MIHNLDFVGSRSMDLGIVQDGLCRQRNVHGAQVGFTLLLNKAFKWGQEAWIRALYKVHFVEEEHFQSGQVGFVLLLNKALKCGQAE